jgi:hypothetical protein
MSKFSISAKAKNLLLSLAESTVQTLNVTACYVSGADQHGIPLALGSKGVKPLMTLISQSTGKLPSSEIIVSHAQKANSLPQWGI